MHLPSARARPDCGRRCVRALEQCQRVSTDAIGQADVPFSWYQTTDRFAAFMEVVGPWCFRAPAIALRPSLWLMRRTHASAPNSRCAGCHRFAARRSLRRCRQAFSQVPSRRPIPSPRAGANQLAPEPCKRVFAEELRVPVPELHGDCSIASASRSDDRMRLTLRSRFSSRFRRPSVDLNCLENGARFFRRVRAS